MEKHLSFVLVNFCITNSSLIAFHQYNHSFKVLDKRTPVKEKNYPASSHKRDTAECFSFFSLVK